MQHDFRPGIWKCQAYQIKIYIALTFWYMWVSFKVKLTRYCTDVLATDTYVRGRPSNVRKCHFSLIFDTLD